MSKLTTLEQLQTSSQKIKAYVDANAGSAVTVDSAMSSTSTNPVQNKVIKAYVDSSYTIAGKKSSSTMGNCATAEGFEVIATGDGCHAEGFQTNATGNYSHAEGQQTSATGIASHAEGYYTKAAGVYAHAANYYTEAADCQTAVGIYNDSKMPAAPGGTTADQTLFTVGNGTGITARANAFRVSQDGKCRGTAAFVSSGADYAEMFEWLDGNPNGEDRRGRFVTLDGTKIRPANGDDPYVLGVVSANPMVLGDHSDDWHGRYLRDVFGSFVKEEQVNEDGVTVQALVLNPDYDPEQAYILRESRPEWAAVGLMGKLVLVDDGTCTVNGCCRPGENGIATAAASGCRVMERIDETHIRVMVK